MTRRPTAWAFFSWPKQRLTDRHRGRRTRLIGRRGLQSQDRQVALHAVGEQVQLLLLTTLELIAGEDAALGERVGGQSAGTVDDRLQRLAAAYRVGAGKTHLAAQHDRFLLAPLRDFLDGETVKGLQFDVGAWRRRAALPPDRC